MSREIPRARRAKGQVAASLGGSDKRSPWRKAKVCHYRNPRFLPGPGQGGEGVQGEAAHQATPEGSKNRDHLAGPEVTQGRHW